MVLAGSRRPHRDEGGLVVDYADVLRQAVENERFRILREVRDAVQKIKTTEPDSLRSYNDRQRTPRAVKDDALAAIDRIEATR